MDEKVELIALIETPTPEQIAEVIRQAVQHSIIPAQAGGAPSRTYKYAREYGEKEREDSV